jgi:hypothetical protein
VELLPGHGIGALPADPAEICVAGVAGGVDALGKQGLAHGLHDRGGKFGVQTLKGVGAVRVAGPIVLLGRIPFYLRVSIQTRLRRFYAQNHLK